MSNIQLYFKPLDDKKTYCLQGMDHRLTLTMVYYWKKDRITKNNYLEVRQYRKGDKITIKYNKEVE